MYDVLAELTYGVPARSRAERVATFEYRQRKWLEQLPHETASVIRALAMQFERGGISELETPTVFDADEVIAAGGLAALARLPSRSPADLLDDTKEGILAP